MGPVWDLEAPKRNRYMVINSKNYTIQGGIIQGGPDKLLLETNGSIVSSSILSLSPCIGLLSLFLFSVRQRKKN